MQITRRSMHRRSQTNETIAREERIRIRKDRKFEVLQHQRRQSPHKYANCYQMHSELRDFKTVE
eukprot:3590221-Rhodomonas_salina.3